jgi:hypothetical protein
MKSIKTIFLATTAVLLSLLTTSCIPTTPGGNPTPSNQFDINITYTLNYGENKKIIVVDGDSIKFRLTYGYGNWVVGKQFSINTKGLNSTFEILTNNNFTNNNNHITTFAANFNVPNDIDTSYSWKTQNPISAEWNEYDNFNFSFYFQAVDGGLNPIPIPQFSGFPSNNDRYIILRKLKGYSYQYYWIKLKNANGLTLQNGRYQMDSITTGQ